MDPKKDYRRLILFICCTVGIIATALALKTSRHGMSTRLTGTILPGFFCRVTSPHGFHTNTAQDNPSPVTLTIDNTDLKGCTLTGQAYGIASIRRINVALSSLSCPPETRLPKIPIDAIIVDNTDGKVGWSAEKPEPHAHATTLYVKPGSRASAIFMHPTVLPKGTA